jgi:hypothetical protein
MKNNIGCVYTYDRTDKKAGDFQVPHVEGDNRLYDNYELMYDGLRRERRKIEEMEKGQAGEVGEEGMNVI